VSSVEIVDLEARSARVVVPDYQLSLAIGKEGQNARLAAKLTGWRIDIRSDTAVDPQAAAVAGRNQGRSEPGAGARSEPKDEQRIGGEQVPGTIEAR
jgi:N utilization substance protein A